MKNYWLTTLKGIAMGAADVVPGVSGGTIAFITGIYEELLNSIKSFDYQALKLILKLRFKEFWKKINGNFLFSLLVGIAISIFSLAKLMTYLLHNHPIQIWSFFFGLIIASVVMVANEIKVWKTSTVISLIIGAVSAYTITALTPGETPQVWWFVFISGAIAICAMILPGISGAFILLLMGQYKFIMQAVSDMDIGIMVIFALGAACGIISFSHFLSWLLKNYHNLTIALLTGFMGGSLNKIWPWKNVDGIFSDTKGVVELEKNVLPSSFEGDPLLWQAILFCLIGFFLIWGIEKIAKSINARKENITLS
ncbi:MAG: DUF368 domain-containing protein [Culturomica sp.]|jgi:putative membrane protein|nr:DUF368 domain-containing protein [Culturomica sp.]